VEWYNIKDKLPERHKNVLCYIEGEPMEVLSLSNTWGCYVWTDTMDNERTDVTHWCELPNPPTIAQQPLSGSADTTPKLPSFHDVFGSDECCNMDINDVMRVYKKIYKLGNFR
jgi:hypothetical protein